RSSTASAATAHASPNRHTSSGPAQRWAGPGSPGRPIIEVTVLAPGGRPPEPRWPAVSSFVTGLGRAVRTRGHCGLAGRRSGRRPGGVPRARPGGPPSVARGRDTPAAVRVPVPEGHGDVPLPAGCGRTWLTSSRVLVAGSAGKQSLFVSVSPLVLLVGRAAVAGRWPATASGRDFGLARAPPGALARDDLATQEKFSAPDSPRLTALYSAGEARDPDRALSAQGLGHLNIGWRLGEEQIRVLHAGQVTGSGRHGHLGAWESLPYRPGGHRRR